MRYMLFILLALLVEISSSAQKRVDFTCIVNQWIQGKIVDDGSIAELGPSRGGPSQLDIRADSTVTFNMGVMCGFGYTTFGKWSINPSDSTITFHYTQKKEFQKGNSLAVINETHHYKIVRLTSRDIMIEPIPNKYNDQIVYLTVINQE